jgi:flagellar motility protein MotE (MotC chaperone)
MPLVVKAKGDKKKSPHLALTHNQLQGGASNGRNVSLLMKSDVEIDENTAALIEKVTGVKVEITKASVNALREALREELKKFAAGDYPWVYVEDFDEEVVIFSNDGGLYYTTYTANGLEVEVGETATEVNRAVSYVAEENKIILSENTDLDSGVYSLIVKSFDNIAKNEKLVDVIKQLTKTEKEKSMTEIEKAVEDATSGLQVELQKAQTDLQKAQDDLKEAQAKVEQFEKAAQEQKDAARAAKVSEVIADEAQAQEFLKSVTALDDAAFDSVVSVMKSKVEQIEKSDLFEKTSERSPGDAQEENALRELIKSKYAPKQ